MCNIILYLINIFDYYFLIKSENIIKNKSRAFSGQWEEGKWSEMLERFAVPLRV